MYPKVAEVIGLLHPSGCGRPGIPDWPNTWVEHHAHFMGRFLMVLLFVCASVLSFAQIGDFPIKDHSPSISGVDHASYDMIFDQQGLMYVANRSGLLRYDGSYWEYIKTPAASFSMAVDAYNKIFVGCMGSFGFLDLTDNGLLYKSISPDTLSNEYFFSTKVIGDSVVFLSRHHLWVYQPGTERLVSYRSPDKFEMVSITADEEGLYINTEIASYTWDGEQTAESGKWIGEDYPPIKVKSSRNGEHQLVLDLTGKLFYLENGSLVHNPLAGLKINDFHWINDTLYVTSTRNDGCIILNANGHRIVGKVDYQGGLPDNEIMALEVDWGMGVWIAHQFGFSRIDPIAPVHCLSNQEGLEGNLIQSVIYKNELIVATSSGAFRLMKDSVFSIKTSAERVKVRTQAASTGTALLKSVFGKKDDQPKRSFRYGQKEGKIFEYARWKYERIPGVITKCNKLLIKDGTLLLGTNSGLFEYDGKEAVKILGSPVKDIIEVPKTNEFIIIDNEHEVDRYLQEADQYSHLTFGYNESLVLSVYGDSKGLLWLVSPGKILSVGTTYYGASVLDEINFPNHYFENPTIVELKQRLYFITNEGYFAYNYQKKSITLDTALTNKLGQPQYHLSDDKGAFWVFDGKVWNHIDRDGSVTTFPYLSLFPDIRFINIEDDGSIYFVDEKNQLFKYYPEEDRNEVYQSNIFYKHLFAKSAYSGYKKQVSLDYDENYLQAEISQPDYLGLLKVEFQHKVEGMDESWSEWSQNNKIDLNFIPDGKYELQVRSRDVFGRVQEGEPITLVIHPPYWRTPWFYMLEVIIFTSLVLISARLNQANASNRFLTEGLTILTIVMIIEFLQSTAQGYFEIASSPIFDFLINLSIALIIFPLEILLKKIIRSGKIPVKVRKTRVAAKGSS